MKVLHRSAAIIFSDADPGGGPWFEEVVVDDDGIHVPYIKVYGGGVDARLHLSQYVELDTKEVVSLSHVTELGSGDIEEGVVSWPKEGWRRDL
jgi:hypothetical protein